MNRVLTFMMMTMLIASALPLQASADASEDIPTNAANTGVHDSLVAALAHADLVSTLEGTGPFTVFAPTDQAFIDAGIDLADFDTPEKMILSETFFFIMYLQVLLHLTQSPMVC